MVENMETTFLEFIDNLILGYETKENKNLMDEHSIALLQLIKANYLLRKNRP